MLPHPIKKRTVAGGAAGNLTVTGIALGDRILHVTDNEAAGADLASEFTVTAANTVNNTGGTNTTGMDLEFVWESYKGGRYDARIPADGGKYVPRGLTRLETKTMRLALLAGASPLRSSDGPISRLIAGSYLIHIEGLIDSLLALNVNGIQQLLLHSENKVILDRHSDVQVLFGNRGTEPFLSVIATRVA